MLYAGASTDPWWGRRFWNFVHQLEQAGELNPGVRAALAARGYAGAETRSAPDVESLKTVLAGFENMESSNTFDGTFGAPASAAGGAE
eukprot:1060108-Pyramimonas_sp.AAC.1